jgi:guanylate kinase
VQYHFRTRDEFEAEIARNGFLEWFEPYGHLKGTPKAPILEQIEAGHDVLLELDIDGARAVAEAFGADAQVLFVVAPSADAQAERLRGRGDEEADIESRMVEARREYDKAVAAGFTILVNEDFERTFAQVVAIIEGRPPA